MYFLFYLKTKDCNTDTKKCSFAIIKVGHPCIYEIHKTHIEAPKQFSHLYKDGDKSCTCPDCKQTRVSTNKIHSQEPHGAIFKCREDSSSSSSLFIYIAL